MANKTQQNLSEIFNIDPAPEIECNFSKSSNALVDTEGETDGLPARFILHGAGWGHGVGLCQIGAAMMGEKGFSYDQILLHY